MQMSKKINQNLKALRKQIRKKRKPNQTIKLVAVTKTRSPKEISFAIESGITSIGENRVQEAEIKDELIWGPDYMIADLSRHITLSPGDVILTGTPCHSRSLDVGDTIEVEITEIGKLSASIVSGPSPRSDVGHLPTDSEEVRRVALGNDERVPELFKINYRNAKNS